MLHIEKYNQIKQHLANKQTNILYKQTILRSPAARTLIILERQYRFTYRKRNRIRFASNKIISHRLCLTETKLQSMFK